ncbi:MAG: RsmD family RNA methyltransferase, partial [Cyanobacteria bacterium J06638_6]
AAEVVGIERSAAAYTVTRENWQKVAQPDQTISLFRGEVVKQLSRLHGQPFDCIYFDPPYASELYAPVLERVVSLKLLHPTGEIAVEHSPEAWSPATISGLEMVREKRYGTTHLAFYAPVKLEH